MRQVGGARRIWQWVLSVFPDQRFDVEDVAADGETVAVRGTMVGTHEGELIGIGPTGKRVAAQQSHWFRVVDGKLTEHRAVRDASVCCSSWGSCPGSSSYSPECVEGCFSELLDTRIPKGPRDRPFG